MHRAGRFPSLMLAIAVVIVSFNQSRWSIVKHEYSDIYRAAAQCVSIHLLLLMYDRAGTLAIASGIISSTKADLLVVMH